VPRTRRRRIAGQCDEALDVQQGAGARCRELPLQGRGRRTAIARARSWVTVVAQSGDTAQPLVPVRSQRPVERLGRDRALPLEVVAEREQEAPPLRRRHLGTHVLDVEPAPERRAEQRQADHRVDKHLRPAHAAQ
jgi:hypothetical protein